MNAVIHQKVRKEIARASGPKIKRCDHLIEWPTKEHILAGVFWCPYCAHEWHIEKNQELTDRREVAYQKLLEHNAAIEQRADRLNSSNIALQRLAMELCSTVEHVERLRQINEGQYQT